MTPAYLFEFFMMLGSIIHRRRTAARPRRLENENGRKSFLFSWLIRCLRVDESKGSFLRDFRLAIFGSNQFIHAKEHSGPDTTTVSIAFFRHSAPPFGVWAFCCDGKSGESARKYAEPILFRHKRTTAARRRFASTCGFADGFALQVPFATPKTVFLF